jgi:hypothetical protein
MHPDLIPASLDARADRHPRFSRRVQQLLDEIDRVAHGNLVNLPALAMWLRSALPKLHDRGGVCDVTGFPGYAEIKDDFVTMCEEYYSPREFTVAAVHDLLRQCAAEASRRKRDRVLLDQRLREVRRQASRAVLEEASVVCVTCVGAGSAMLKGLEFTLVLADEATQAQEHAVLIPLARMAKAGHTGDVS